MGMGDYQACGERDDGGGHKPLHAITRPESPICTCCDLAQPDAQWNDAKCDVQQLVPGRRDLEERAFVGTRGLAPVGQCFERGAFVDLRTDGCGSDRRRGAMRAAELVRDPERFREGRPSTRPLRAIRHSTHEGATTPTNTRDMLFRPKCATLKPVRRNHAAASAGSRTSRQTALSLPSSSGQSSLAFGACIAATARQTEDSVFLMEVL